MTTQSILSQKSSNIHHSNLIYEIMKSYIHDLDSILYISLDDLYCFNCISNKKAERNNIGYPLKLNY